MTSKQALSLYRSLIRESKKFPSYNFRNYFLRRIKDGFRDNRNLKDNNEINKQISEGSKTLELIKRQVIIGDLYKADKLVIEK